MRCLKEGGSCDSDDPANLCGPCTVVVVAVAEAAVRCQTLKLIVEVAKLIGNKQAIALARDALDECTATHEAD